MHTTMSSLKFRPPLSSGQDLFDDSILKYESLDAKSSLVMTNRRGWEELSGTRVVAVPVEVAPQAEEATEVTASQVAMRPRAAAHDP